MVSIGCLILLSAQSGAEFKATSDDVNSDAPEIYSGDCAVSRDGHSVTFLGKNFPNI